ncbi:MAG: VOC family protein [Chloroflexota bacterium]|nr:VOC family protein [Chloroflexota bacterium]
MTDRIFYQQITFLHSQDLQATRHFYNEVLGLPLVRDQGSCLIFSVTESAYLGFCEHITPIKIGRRVILTLVTNNVDEWYAVLKDRGVDLISEPKSNPLFQIYHFFLNDPDGYWIEIQRFDQPL